jgi:hypothetical protein
MGYVYFIRKGSEDIFKIGIATNPEWRRLSLSTGNEAQLYLCATIEDDDARRQEAWFHRELLTRRMNLEWFHVAWEELLEYLDTWYAPDMVTIYHDNIENSLRHSRYGEASPAALLELGERIGELEGRLSQSISAFVECDRENQLLEVEKIALIHALRAHRIPLPDEVRPSDEPFYALVVAFLGKGTPLDKITFELSSLLRAIEQQRDGD